MRTPRCELVPIVDLHEIVLAPTLASTLGSTLGSHLLTLPTLGSTLATLTWRFTVQSVDLHEIGHGRLSTILLFPHHPVSYPHI